MSEEESENRITESKCIIRLNLKNITIYKTIFIVIIKREIVSFIRAWYKWAAF